MWTEGSPVSSTSQLTQSSHSQIHGYYRATGASISKAQAEFTTNVFSNEAVRSGVANAAVAGVRQGFQVSPGGGEGGGEGRGSL